MKISTVVLLLAGAGFFFTACSKNAVKPAVTINAQGKDSAQNQIGNTPVSDSITWNPSFVAALVGKWNLVNDSTWSLRETAQLSKGANYIGQQGDYLEFTSAGKIYIKEGPAIDSAYCVLETGNQILIKYYTYPKLMINGGVPILSTLTPLNVTAGSFTFSTGIFTPGGAFLRAIYLKK